MKVENLKDLFVHELKDLYSAEEQILEHLPDMIEKAQDQDLRSTLQSHQKETRQQRQRLERMAEKVGVDLEGHRCKGIAGILKEASELVEDHANDPEARNAAIISGAQRVEHYEMAGYGTAHTYARMLGHDDAARLLQETLDEEKEADRKLTKIAEGHVNREAMAAAD